MPVRPLLASRPVEYCPPAALGATCLFAMRRDSGLDCTRGRVAPSPFQSKEKGPRCFPCRWSAMLGALIAALRRQGALWTVCTAACTTVRVSGACLGGESLIFNLPARNIMCQSSFVSALNGPGGEPCMRAPLLPFAGRHWSGAMSPGCAYVEAEKPRLAQHFFQGLSPLAPVLHHHYGMAWSSDTLIARHRTNQRTKMSNAAFSWPKSATCPDRRRPPLSRPVAQREWRPADALAAACLAVIRVVQSATSPRHV